MAEEEERVGCIAGVGDDEGTMEFFGYGVYKGKGIPEKNEVTFMGWDFHDLIIGQAMDSYKGLDKPMTEEQIEKAFADKDEEMMELFGNPVIELDSGEVVYGAECWWGPEANVKKALEDYEKQGIKIIPITVKEYRGAN